MKVDGRIVFWMLFAIAFAYSVNPALGALTLAVVIAASNKDAVLRAVQALDDAARRLERQIEQRGWFNRRALDAGRGDAEASQQPGVTTLHNNKREASVVTPEAPAAGVTAARRHNTPYINSTAGVVTLPPPSQFDPATPRPSQFAVPLGVDETGAFRWLDFERDALHIGLYGTSGCGKDHLLRLWFAALLDEPGVRWAILDGKGDWLTPNIARLPQMLFPPAGGYGEDGQRRILEAIQAVNAEAKRRFGLLLEAGVRSVDEYNQTAADPLPLLIVLATDIIDVVDETERLLVALVSKARALGIRVVASMQTPTGKRMEWRMNLSTLISGALVDGSQDAPALGVRDPKALRFRPSQLPPPPGERGLFVVRHNNEQFVVRTPALRGDFDALVNARNDAALLEMLLSAVPEHQDALGRGGERPVPATPVPAHQKALGRIDAGPKASESPGTVVDPSPSPTLETAENSPETGISGGDGWDGDGGETLINALAALQRAGVTRLQARALGIRFRNDDWARARRAIEQG